MLTNGVNIWNIFSFVHSQILSRLWISRNGMPIRRTWSLSLENLGLMRVTDHCISNYKVELCRPWERVNRVLWDWEIGVPKLPRGVLSKESEVSEFVLSQLIQVRWRIEKRQRMKAGTGWEQCLLWWRASDSTKSWKLSLYFIGRFRKAK